MSFNTSSHKISGLRSPALASAMSVVGTACLTPSSHSPVRRAMQSISNATLRNAYSLGRTGGRQGMGDLHRAAPRNRRELGSVSQSLRTAVGDLLILAQWSVGSTS